MAVVGCRHYFLVYNATVIYWKLCRPFLRDGHYRSLTASLQDIVRSLDDIDDKDYGWRAQLKMCVIALQRYRNVLLTSIAIGLLR